MTLTPGDPVEFTDEAKRLFPRTKPTGVMLGRNKFDRQWIIVHRDGVKRKDQWHESFWQLVNGTSSTCPTCGQEIAGT